MRKNLEFPWMRVDLRSYLESLSDFDFQKNCWIDANCPFGVEDSFDDNIHFFFDDTGLAQNSFDLIGCFLYDENEAILISDLCSKIEYIFNIYGTNLTDEEYINKLEWLAVIEKAQLALSKILDNDLVYASLDSSE